VNLKFFLKNFAYLILAVAVSCANAGAYEDWFRAVQSNDAGTVRALLQRGMDPNTRDEQGQVALFLALRGDAFAVAETLLQHPQLDPNAANSVGETPLMMAALHGLIDWESRLLERGAKLHQPGWSRCCMPPAARNPRPWPCCWTMVRRWMRVRPTAPPR
jgi:hypothetical protein